ncbi:hypothetical protein N2152v2_004089 [Parachlorella kessleri]
MAAREQIATEGMASLELQAASEATGAASDTSSSGGSDLSGEQAEVAAVAAGTEPRPRRTVDLRELVDPMSFLHIGLRGILKLAYEQQDERLATEAQVALLGVSDIFLIAAELAGQQLASVLPILEAKVEELGDLMEDPQVPDAALLLHCIALRCNLDEVAGSIGPQLAQYLGRLALGTVFATGTLRLLGEILDPQNGVMPLQGQNLYSGNGLAGVDYVKDLATLRCGDELEWLLARPFWELVKHLIRELVTPDKRVELSPVVQAAQRSNSADSALLRYLYEEVVNKFAALPQEEHNEPETRAGNSYHGDGKQTAGTSVEEAVDNVRELIKFYRALRGPSTHGMLGAVAASGVARRGATPSHPLDLVEQALYCPLESLFSEDLFIKLVGVIDSIMPTYSIGDDALFTQLFEGAIFPLLVFLKALLCNDILVDTQSAAIIRNLVKEVKRTVPEARRAGTTVEMGKMLTLKAAGYSSKEEFEDERRGRVQGHGGAAQTLDWMQ